MNKWETVSEETSHSDGSGVFEECTRLKVPNGWLVKVTAGSASRGLFSVNIDIKDPKLVFINDPAHEWEL